ncbi:hypothetical protein [Streptococcus handemini]
MSVRLIAHALIQHRQAYLVLKRSSIKRGQANVYPRNQALQPSTKI